MTTIPAHGETGEYKRDLEVPFNRPITFTGKVVSNSGVVVPDKDILGEIVILDTSRQICSVPVNTNSEYRCDAYSSATEPFTVSYQVTSTLGTIQIEGNVTPTTDGTTVHNQDLIIPVISDFTATAIAAGNSHTVALKQDGTVWAWGNNGSGRLGDGSTTSSRTPVQVADLENVVAIAAGNSHTVALKQDGTVWAWGDNRDGRLGDGTTTNRSTPVKVIVID